MANVAFVLAEDFEDSEFRVPFDALLQAGHVIKILGTQVGVTVKGSKGKETVTIDELISDKDVNDFDALVIPGGYSPDRLRTNEDVVAFVKTFCEAGKIVAAVCHGPSLLIEAEQVRDRTLTSWPSVKKDLQNAGAHWVDQEVVIDGALITSRRPGDLQAFSAAILKALEPGSPAHLDEQKAAAQRQNERTLTQ